MYHHSCGIIFYLIFNNFVCRDTMIVCFGNCLTSFVAGFAIFSVLGFMAKELNAPIEEIATPGTGLAFVAYPDLVTRFPGIKNLIKNDLSKY